MFIICLALVLRVPSFVFPLDYDVGTHLFNGMEVAERGFYSVFHGLRPVGILAIFALIYKLFGSSPIWVNIIGAIFWVLSSWLIYKISSLIARSKPVAIISVIIFVLLTASRSLQGEMANMETFFIPMNLSGIYLFFLAREKTRRYLLICSGIFFGSAFLIKHLAIFSFFPILAFNAFPIAHFKNHNRNFRRKIKLFVIENIYLLAGFLTPLTAFTAYFLSRGQLSDFFYWQFMNMFNNVNRYSQFGSPLTNLKNHFIPIFNQTYFFWISALLGIIYSIFNKRKAERFFIIFWITSVFVGLYYRWWFFSHHFLQFIAPVSISAGFFLVDLSKILKEKMGPLAKKNIFVSSLFIIGALPLLKENFNYFFDYSQLIKGKINNEEYLSRSGFDVGDTGWLPFSEAAGYLKQETTKGEAIFVWGTAPITYALAERSNYFWFFYKYALLPDELTHRTFKGWFPNYLENRKTLLHQFEDNAPNFIAIEVQPETIFDEMISFQDFSRLIFAKYQFSKDFGNMTVYKIDQLKATPSNYTDDTLIIPLEIIKRYSAIAETSVRDKTTEIIFEPMVDPNGALRKLKATYPEIIKIDFMPISAKSLGQDGSDFVGNALDKPSGIIDLHFQVNGVEKPFKFVRVKSDGVTYNNHSYGVNHALKISQNGDTLDLYLEPPSKWEEKKYEIYVIYEDGSLAKTEVEAGKR